METLRLKTFISVVCVAVISLCELKAEVAGARPLSADLAEIRKKAEAGVAEAQLKMGMAYANGEGVSKDEAEAEKWYRSSAELGNTKAQGELAWALARRRELEGAEIWFRRAAESGDVNAKFNLSQIIADKSPAESFAIVLELAERGYDVAMIEVGRRMVKGEAGTNRRIADGVGWLERASEKGSKLAAYVLGELYWTGAVSGTQDRAAAVIHFEKATDGGVSGPVNTRMIVALWHCDQENPQRQVSRAIKILGPIARSGDNEAQALLRELLIEESKTLEGLAMLVASHRITGDEAVLKILRARLAGRPDEDLAKIDELAESIQRAAARHVIDKYLPAK
jgi:hypothetical protein